MDVSELKDEIKIFLTNPANDPNLPEREDKVVEGLPTSYRGGHYAISKGVISLQNDRGTSYAAYIAVQNELVKAINELRDDASMTIYGKKFLNLSEDEQDVIKECIPQNISEAEPKDVAKK